MTVGRDGMIDPDEADQGLFVRRTRILSRLGYLVDGRPPTPVTLANVRQESSASQFQAALDQLTLV